jgi:acetyl/propionyl-CoA carboxylase alpha subunit
MAFKLWLDGGVHEVEIVARRPHLVISVDGREHEVSAAGTRDDGRQSLEIGGMPIHVIRVHSGDREIVRLGGRTFEARLLDPRSDAHQSGAGRDHVRAPMPGAVVAVHKQAGAEVKRGETIVTIESMKLQMALTAPRDGVIAELTRKEGESFDKDEVIARLETLGEE